MNVRLHIDRLIVEGIDVPHRGKLQAAVEGELARLIGERGIEGAARIGNVPHVTAPTIVDGGTAAHLGTNIASAVHGAIGSRK